MDSIQALLYDEDEDDLAAVPQRLRHPFGKLGWIVSWTTATGPDKVRELFDVPGAAYDLVVVDLPADPGPGLEVVRAARERFSGAFILVVSGGDAEQPDLFDEARRSGAHRVLRRFDFSVDARETSPTAVATQIHNHLLDTRAVAPIAVTYDELDPDIEAFVHGIGEPTLCRLYTRILGSTGRTTRSMSLGYISGGHSGAAVCAVTAAIDNSGVRTHHVLKVSMDKDSLMREAQRGAEAYALMRPALMAHQAPGYAVGPVNGWYALASQLQGSALTLRGWLARGASDAAVEDVFAALFTDGLGGVYADTTYETESPADLLRTPYYRQRRILHSIKELSPVLTHPDGCRLPAAMVGELTDRLASFVNEGRLGPADPQRMAARTTAGAFAHGDLSGTNVLVYEGRHPEPAVIDASRFGHAHWAADPARLAVDLLMHNVDAGVESMFFTGFEQWRDAAARLGGLESLAVPETGPRPAAQAADTRSDRSPDTSGPETAGAPAATGFDAALAALNWLTANLRAFCPGVVADKDYRERAWEWHTALARCLLRSSYDQEITVPKRALALVAAHDQLSAAAEAMPR